MTREEAIAKAVRRLAGMDRGSMCIFRLSDGCYVSYPDRTWPNGVYVDNKLVMQDEINEALAIAAGASA